MLIYGYAKDYYYSGDGMLLIKVRIPNLHGPYDFQSFRGSKVKRYIKDEDLPFYPSVLLPHLPIEGDVLILASTDEGNEHFVVIGLTGASYASGVTDLGGV